MRSSYQCPPLRPGQINKHGTSDAFVAKLNGDGSALSYATYLGGSCAEAAFAIQVDSAGQAFVSGFTESEDFPVTPNAGCRDARECPAEGSGWNIGDLRR
jgi:hypothetical protein